MFHKDYSNFVKPKLPEPHSNPRDTIYRLNGAEAQRLYLEEVKDVKINESSVINTRGSPLPGKRSYSSRKRKPLDLETSDTNLFMCVQNNNVDSLNAVLDTYPDKINTVDEFGWSLLMIACQANSVETVKELLKRGVDMSMRDKAGNSARSLVIKNKNLLLADILLNANKYEPKSKITPNVRHKKEEYICEICNNKVFADKQEHLSSTVHNLNASKGKKVPVKYMIPPSNIGYQIMVKEGWNKDSGLGRDGSGKIYPVKAVQKLDRKGLGLEKKKIDSTKEKESSKSKLKRDFYENRRFEVNFRREFY